MATKSALLSHIPADTPYVFAMLEPVPEKIIDKIFEAMAPFSKKAEEGIAAELKSLEGQTTKKAKRQKAILKELTGKLNPAGFEKLGFGKFPQVAIYGVGVLPVFRVTLQDPQKLKDAIGRIEKDAGEKIPTLKFGDVEYWGVDEDGMSLAIAIRDKDLVLAFGPTPAKQNLFSIALGTKKPAKSLAEAGTLDAIASANGFTGHGLGFIDVINVSETLLGDGKGVNGEIWKAVGSPVPPVPGECKTEYMAMAKNFPRMVFGYTEMNEKLFRAKYIVESKASWAKDLAGLAAAVPGLKLEGEGLFSFGASMNIPNIKALAGKIVADVKANPYKCPHLAEINENIGNIEMGLNQPIPPALAGIKGVRVVVESGDFTTSPPKNIKALALVASDKPMELFSMAQGFVPPLAQLKVVDDGKPIALPAGLIPPVVDAPHLAMTKGAIAVSVGAGHHAKLGAAMSAGVPAMKPLMAISYDIKELMDMMAKSGEMGAEEMEVLGALSGLLARTSYAVMTTEKGIVMEQIVNLP